MGMYTVQRGREEGAGIERKGDMKGRRACKYEAMVREAYIQKRKERRLCTYEAVVRGACTERKGKR